MLVLTDEITDTIRSVFEQYFFLEHVLGIVDAQIKGRVQSPPCALEVGGNAQSRAVIYLQF